MENEHNMNTKLNDTNVSNCDTEPNKLIKLFYGGSPWQSIDIQVTADLSDVVGHFDFAGTFTMPQLLNCGEYDEAAIELLKQNGVEFYVVQGAELHDWGHLGTVLTVAQSQLDDDGKLEMESLMSVSVTDCAVDSSGEEESAEPDELEAHQTVQRLMTEADEADQRADEAELKLAEASVGDWSVDVDTIDGEQWRPTSHTGLSEAAARTLFQQYVNGSGYYTDEDDPADTARIDNVQLITNDSAAADGFISVDGKTWDWEEDDNMCPHCESLGRQMISRFNVKGEWCTPCQDGCCDCSECQNIDDQAEQAATEPEA